MPENAEYQHFELTRFPDALVIGLYGPRLLEREGFPYHELNDELYRLVEVETVNGFVLDYSQVEAIDTRAVQVLVGLWKRLKSRKKHLTLCGLSGVPLQIMKLVRFDLLFDFHETKTEAVAALRE